MANRVILHGFWGSPFSKRVELALRAKKIPFEFVEEDVVNKGKSPLLLKYNPVYKKVPVLIHNGKAIVESLVILEYIDETWRNGPRLLLEDPYKRAQVRFWVNFVHQELLESLSLVFTIDGEAQEKANKELFEKMKVLEQGIRESFLDLIPIDSNSIGLLDTVMFSIFGSYEAQEQVLGFKVINPVKNPLLFSWMRALKDLPVVKDLVSVDKLVALLKSVRNNSLKYSDA